jgi:dihydroorotate dehydrogenase
MYALLRRLLFHLEPERAHALALGLVRAAGALPPSRWLLRALYGAPAAARPVDVFGLRFPNAVGLAAGYDKDGLGWRGLGCLGFGHLELGTVTPLPQPGNPRPRVFRLPAERALVNRLGFPSRGAEFVARRLLRRRAGARGGPLLGVNIGKNRDTPLAAAAADYVALLERFAPLADYLVVNVSSPNTVGLRRLQARATLEALLTALVAARRPLVEGRAGALPLLVKLAPDLTDGELDDALDAVLAAGLDGVVATNTTLDRAGLRSPAKDEAGGLSGAPLLARSTAVVRAIHARTGGRLPIVAVGGVAGPDDARAKLDAGASLVQVYTGLVYEGPGLVRRILQALARGSEPEAT